MRAFILSGVCIKTQLFVSDDVPVHFTLSMGYQAVDLWHWLKGERVRFLLIGVGVKDSAYTTLEEITPEDFKLLLGLWVWKRKQPICHTRNQSTQKKFKLTSTKSLMN